MMESRKNLEEMSAHERMKEIAAIIFQALIRAKKSKITDTPTT